MLEVGGCVLCVRDGGWYDLCTVLYAGGPWRVTSVCWKCVGGAGVAGGNTLCDTLYAVGYGGWALFAGVLEVPEVPKVMRLC